MNCRAMGLTGPSRMGMRPFIGPRAGGPEIQEKRPHFGQICREGAILNEQTTSPLPQCPDPARLRTGAERTSSESGLARFPCSFLKKT
jgi:hypothetical protein